MYGVSDGIPRKLLTDRDGPSARLRVDSGQTGFFAGREFRTYYEFSIATATTRSLRFISPVEFILFVQELAVDQGGIRLSVWVGATSTGSWTTIPVVGKNRMLERPQPYYTGLATAETGGAFTGGTEVEVIRNRTASLSVTAATVGASDDDVRGLPAGTYHILMAPLPGVNDTSTGVYRLAWEERVP